MAAQMVLWNVYYEGEFCGEATLPEDWHEAQKGACDLLEQTLGDVVPAFVQANRVK